MSEESRKPARFSGRDFFVQAEGRPFDWLVADVRHGLTDLQESASGRLLDKLQRVRATIDPCLDAMDRAGSELQLRPHVAYEGTIWFAGEIRASTRSKGDVRVLIERVFILLRVLQLRTIAVHQALDPQRLDQLRQDFMDGLWSEPTPPLRPGDPDSDWRQLSLQLHHAWISRIEYEWGRLNWLYLGAVLRSPRFELCDSRTIPAQFVSEGRTISMSGWHIVTCSWRRVIEFLSHAVAQQLLTEVWHQPEAGPDGPEFRAACEKLRCSPDRTGDAEKRDREEDPSDSQDKIIVRIRKLMALGQSSNEHEAALAMKRAAELLLKHNLGARPAGPRRRFFRRCVGAPLSRREAYHHAIGGILIQHFFVRVVWSDTYLALSDTSASQMELIGTFENLQIAEYVFHFLLETGDQLWRAHRRGESFHGGRKSQFLCGLIHGFRMKLDAENARIVKESALVPVPDTELEAHVEYLYPGIRTCRVGSVTRGGDYHSGVEQGREISLRMGVTERTFSRVAFLPGSGDDDQAD